MIAAFALIVVCILYRLVTAMAGGADWLPNFAPLGAIALCGAALLPKRWALALPLTALFLSDLVLNSYYGVALFDGGMIFRYLALGLIARLGWSLRERRTLAVMLPASLAGSVLFYVLSNTGSWLALPGYSPTLAGWMQAQWLGLPGFPPAYLFLRNTMVSDLVFTALMLLCVAASARREQSPLGTKSLQSA